MSETKIVNCAIRTRSAELQSDTVNADARTVELVWTTGAEVVRGGLFTDPYREQLSMDPAHIRMQRMNSGAPLLNAHNRFDANAVIGVVERAWLDGEEGRAVVRFADTPDVENIWAKVKSKIIRNVSVGAAVHKVEDVTERGAKMKTFRAVDWEPMEISVVPVGADAGAQMRSAEVTYPCEVVVRSEPDQQNGEAALTGPPTNTLTIVRERFELERLA